jgi:hypothetical protein
MWLLKILICLNFLKSTDKLSALFFSAPYLGLAISNSFVGIYAEKEWLNSSNSYIGIVQISSSTWQICSGLLMLNSIFGYF